MYQSIADTSVSTFIKIQKKVGKNVRTTDLKWCLSTREQCVI